MVCTREYRAFKRNANANANVDVDVEAGGDKGDAV